LNEFRVMIQAKDDGDVAVSPFDAFYCYMAGLCCFLAADGGSKEDDDAGMELMARCTQSLTKNKRPLEVYVSNKAKRFLGGGRQANALLEMLEVIHLWNSFEHMTKASRDGIKTLLDRTASTMSGGAAAGGGVLGAAAVAAGEKEQEELPGPPQPGGGGGAGLASAAASLEGALAPDNVARVHLYRMLLSYCDEDFERAAEQGDAVIAMAPELGRAAKEDGTLPFTLFYRTLVSLDLGDFDEAKAFRLRIDKCPAYNMQKRMNFRLHALSRRLKEEEAAADEL
jgi:hypothetical protein